MIEQILSRYAKLRTDGMDAKTALEQLRSDIARLDSAQRLELTRQLREMESQKAAQKPPSAPVSPIKPIVPLATEEAKAPVSTPAVNDSTKDVPAFSAVASVPPAEPAPAAPSGEKIACTRCGKLNRAQEVFCYSCGQLLVTERSQFDTRNLNASEMVRSDDYFGDTSVLVFMVKSNRHTYKVQPQQHRHEIVVGRGAGGTMKPDVDLADQQADEFGVSRMHLTVMYNAKQHTVSVSDMNSANGTFINGQRLHPQEVRVLRHGDELRLGRLTLVVYFYHSKPLGIIQD